MWISAIRFPQNISIQKGTSSENLAQRTPCEKLGLTRVDSRMRGCACLPSLSTINSALLELLDADQRYSSQIAEIIRRDPSSIPASCLRQSTERAF